jgi:transposase
MMDTTGWQDSVDARAWRVEAEHARGEAVFWRGEAERWREKSEQQVDENTALREQNTELLEKVEALAGQVATYARMLFGDSSERSRRKKSEEQPPVPEPDQGAGAGRGKRGQRKGSPGHGRRDYSSLDMEEQVHDLPPGQLCCPACGTTYQRFDEERCEQIEWRVRLVRVVHRRPTYRRACRCPGKGVICAPPPPKAIAKGLLGTSFLARLLVLKFGLGLPTHRIAAMLAAEGLDLAEGTLAGVFAALSKLLAPLAAAIVARNAAAAHLHVDETRWSVFEEVEGKDSHRWWLWVFVAEDTVVFHVAASRSLAVLSDHLGLQSDAEGRLALPEGRELRLSSDFYAVYQSIATVDGVDSLWCWAHIRRRFVKVADANPRLRGWAQAWLELIGALYTAHKALNCAEEGSSAHRLATAQYHAALNGIDAERQAQTQLPGQHPAAAKVIATINREWEGLARHREHPELPLDNNTAERALRTPVVGRKNFYGSGSTDSAQLASRAWTVLATAERAGYNPLAYLTSYLNACAAAGAKPPTGDALARFLPWTASPADTDTWRRPAAGRPTTTDAQTSEHTETSGAPAAPDDSAGPAP